MPIWHGVGGFMFNSSSSLSPALPHSYRQFIPDCATFHLRLPDGRPILLCVLVLVGACQSGTVWAGLCLIHHHYCSRRRHPPSLIIFQKGDMARSKPTACFVVRSPINTRTRGRVVVPNSPSRLITAIRSGQAPDEPSSSALNKKSSCSKCDIGESSEPVCNSASA